MEKWWGMGSQRGVEGRKTDEDEGEDKMKEKMIWGGTEPKR